MIKEKIKLDVENFGILELDKGITTLELSKKLKLKDKPLLGKLNGKRINPNFPINESGVFKFRVDPLCNCIWEETSSIFRKFLTDYLLQNKKVLKEVNFKIEDDFFYVDYLVEKSISENDLEIIKEAILQEIAKFKEDLSKISPLDYKLIKYARLFNLSGVENAENALINRIHGFAGLSKEFLDAKNARIQEKIDRDHRNVAKNLEIFFISPEVGKGLPIWLPNGVKLKSVIRQFIFEQERKYDYEIVETPNLGSIELYKTSGHYYHYRDNMFPEMKISEQETFILRPMACPHHIQIFKYKPRTYKELPKRYSEQVYMYRYEPSGALLGLERVRSMNLSDSHVFLRPDQLDNEINVAYQIIEDTLRKFNIEIDYIELALHDPNDKQKYHGDPEMWSKAEVLLRTFLINKKIKFIEKVGEAAFYGPKIDIQIKSALGHNLTVSTVQLDFFLPEKFNVKYTDRNNQEQQVIMIHRGLIGTYERFISILLEQTKGHFPLWLAPVQTVVIPITQKHSAYARKVYEFLRDNNVRVILDNSDERLSYRIRLYQTKKINIQLIIGDNEIKENLISYRLYGEKEVQTIPMQKLLELYK